MIWWSSLFRKQITIFSHGRSIFTRNGTKIWTSKNTISGIGGTCLNEYKPNENEVFPNFQQINVKLLLPTYDKIKFGNITTQEGKLLLQCCGNTSINSTFEERQQMCENVYQDLIKYNKLNLDIYLTYIRICTENKNLINSKTFLENLRLQPDDKIYKYLLENVCECGDISQVFGLLENMKHYNVPVDQNVFNNLVLVHTFKGGLESGENVLATMKAAQVSETVETYISILKGIIRRQNYDEFKTFLERYKISLDENQALNIFTEFGLSQTVEWLTEMKDIFNNLAPTRDFINNLKNICVYLIYLKKSSSAVKLYTYFKQPEENYGFFILEEMLHSKTNPSEVISTAKYFLENFNNEKLFENLTEFALKHEYFDIVWILFENLKELRPHFFWPLLLNSKNNEGETGIFDVIQKINKTNVRLDSDSLEYYIIPFCNLDDITSVVEKLKKVGFTTREIVSPMLLVLLRNGEVKQAAALCGLYNVQIQGEKLFKIICSTWKITKDPLVVSILERYCESVNSENDLMGDFLIKSLKKCRNQSDYANFYLLIKAFIEKKLKVTTTTADSLREIVYLKMGENETEVSKQILDGIDQILEFKLKPETDYIPHPRHMNVDELECHLVELIEKNMETRGVLRRLIQVHANMGNSTRVDQLRKQFLDDDYMESIGMKSSLMYSYTKAGNWKSSLEVYNEIKKFDPKFIIDNFKIIDLATLLVKNDRVSEATNLLDEAAKNKVYGGPQVQRNCVELLNAFKNENEQSSMFNFLMAKGFCRINNIMLGPLVRIFLNRGDLEQASSVYIELAQKYKFTPLQFELIREIAKTKNEELLQKVLNSTNNIHGPLATQVTLIGALAEIGEEKILTKILLTTQLPVGDFIKNKCVRWIKEEKPEALLTLANCCKRMSKNLIDVNFIYESLMKIFTIKNDCEGAIKFYESLSDNELVNKQLENQLYILLKQNNYLIPKALQINRQK